jgi:predicted RNA-binding Zn-ribbon protein involved in translation (DUF1610 family)
MSLKLWEIISGEKAPEEVKCPYCGEIVKREVYEDREWNDDDDQIHFLCPNCDFDLLEPVSQEEYLTKVFSDYMLCLCVMEACVGVVM